MIFPVSKQKKSHKKICKFLIGSFLILLTHACKRDLGTSTLNKVDGYNLLISGINTDYVAAVGDTVNIMPIVKNPDGTLIDTSKYETVWTKTSILNGSAVRGPGAIDSVKSNNFHYVLSLNIPNIIGLSTWTFKITNKATGIFTQQRFSILVYSPTTEGFYVLSQVGSQKSKLGVIFYNTGIESYDTVSDILNTMYSKEGINPPFTLDGNPICVNYGTSNLATFFGDFISVITTQNGSMLNASTLTPQGNNNNSSSVANFAYLLGNVLSGYSPSNIQSYASSIYFGFSIINYNGYLYEDNSVNTGRYSSFNSAPLVAPGSSSPMVASKWIATNDNLINAASNSPNFILFDETRQSFYNYYFGSLNNLPITGYTAKNKLLYNHYTDYGGGRYYAVMQSNTSDSTYLLTFNASGVMYNYSFLGTSNINSSTRFAISSTNGYLLYNVGNQIYEYDIVKNKAFLMTSYPGRTISYMEGPQIPWNINAADRTISLSQSIIIATYDSTNLQNSGRVDIYNVPQANGIIQKQNTYEGFGKIVSMTYKQSRS